MLWNNFPKTCFSSLYVKFHILLPRRYKSNHAPGWYLASPWAGPPGLCSGRMGAASGNQTVAVTSEVIHKKTPHIQLHWEILTEGSVYSWAAERNAGTNINNITSVCTHWSCGKSLSPEILRLDRITESHLYDLLYHIDFHPVILEIKPNASWL